MNFAEWVGTLAAICTTLSFVPQIVKIRRQGGADVSFLMLFIYLGGLLLWLSYGLMLHSPAIIGANAVTAVLDIIAMYMKATHPNRFAGTKTAPQIAASAASGLPAPAKNLVMPASMAIEPISTRYIDASTGGTVVTGAPHAADGARKPRLAVDMDEVIADAFGKMLRAYNERTGRDITKEQIAREGIEILFAPEFLTPEIKTQLDSLQADRGFFADLELVEGGQDALRELSRDFEIFIASAAMDVPSSFDAKYQWLKQYFPFVPPSHYVFCGDKSILNADFLVDDRPRHFEHFRGTGILFTAPHNARRDAKLRANTWDDVVRILREASAATTAAP